MLSSHPRPVFTLDGDAERDSSVAPSRTGGVDRAYSPNATPRLGAAWSPFEPSTVLEPLTPAELALAAFEASRSRRKRSLTLDSTSTTSSSSSLSSSTSSSGGEYDDYLTPDTSVASISPCASPMELENDLRSWQFHSPVSRSMADVDFFAAAGALERSLSGASTASSSDTEVPSEPLTRSASSAPCIASSRLQSRPHLARCLTAPELGGCGMVRSVSVPVATQSAHDAALQGVRAGVERLEADAADADPEQRRALDDLLGRYRLEAEPQPSMPWPYNMLKTAPDTQLRPHVSKSTRPGLSRATTFDAALLAQATEGRRGSRGC